MFFFFFFFFFSSRRRHTRSYGDWSSDVCSSDLYRRRDGPSRHSADALERLGDAADRDTRVERLLVRRSRAVADELAYTAVEIGRASCRERVWIWVGGGCVKKRVEEKRGCAEPVT